MKTLAIVFTLSALCMLAACETTSAIPAQSNPPPGTALGDSGVHVSGDVHTGGSISPR